MSLIYYIIRTSGIYRVRPKQNFLIDSFELLPDKIYYCFKIEYTDNHTPDNRIILIDSDTFEYKLCKLTHLKDYFKYVDKSKISDEVKNGIILKLQQNTEN